MGLGQLKATYSQRCSVITLSVRSRPSTTGSCARANPPPPGHMRPLVVVKGSTGSVLGRGAGIEGSRPGCWGVTRLLARLCLHITNAGHALDAQNLFRGGEAPGLHEGLLCQSSFISSFPQFLV